MPDRQEPVALDAKAVVDLIGASLRPRYGFEQVAAALQRERRKAKNDLFRDLLEWEEAHA